MYSICRDSMSGRMYASCLLLERNAGWDPLLEDRFVPGSTSGERHKMIYRHSMCSCLICTVKSLEVIRFAINAGYAYAGIELDTLVTDNNPSSINVARKMGKLMGSTLDSAAINFIILNWLPSRETLLAIGDSAVRKELQIRPVALLCSRALAKLDSANGVREISDT